LCGSIPIITDMTVLPSTVDENRDGHSWFKMSCAGQVPGCGVRGVGVTVISSAVELVLVRQLGVHL
jgi:hypothetical protein